MEVRKEQALEAALPWFLLNVARLSAYLLAASIGTGIFTTSSIRHGDLRFLVDEPLVYFFGGGLISLPGTALSGS
jgi:hypothetical protein